MTHYEPYELSDSTLTLLSSLSGSNTLNVFGFESAESAIGFGSRLQRLHSTGLCSSGLVFDPRRPCQNPKLRKLRRCSVLWQSFKRTMHLLIDMMNSEVEINR